MGHICHCIKVIQFGKFFFRIMAKINGIFNIYIVFKEIIIVIIKNLGKIKCFRVFLFLLIEIV